MTTEEARKFLEEQGYYTGNLWHVSNVQQVKKCSDAEALDVLQKALTNEWVVEQIQFAIKEFSEDV
jgi:hypothetical protein